MQLYRPNVRWIQRVATRQSWSVSSASASIEESINERRRRSIGKKLVTNTDYQSKSFIFSDAFTTSIHAVVLNHRLRAQRVRFLLHAHGWSHRDHVSGQRVDPASSTGELWKQGRLSRHSGLEQRKSCNGKHTTSNVCGPEQAGKVYRSFGSVQQDYRGTPPSNPRCHERTSTLRACTPDLFATYVLRTARRAVQHGHPTSHYGP
jgi:hypothetical protein